jgi:acyl-CoA reductase-like NAD-dependent aldehyde dehydrogenase
MGPMNRSVASPIAGNEVGGAPGGQLRSVNPARNSEVVAEVVLGDAKTFAEAARAARAAQQAWSDVPAPVRGRAIAHIGRLVEANADALARLVTREIGKPYAEALGEVREIVDTCDFFLGEGRRLYGQTVPSEMPDKQLFTFRNPVGVVAVITAGNFPVAVPSWYLIPALLCGNCVIWKPAEYAAASARALFDLLTRGGGQRCTSLGTVIAHEDVRDEFTGKLDKATRQAAVGDPFSDVLFGPMLGARFGRRFEEYLSWIRPHHRLLGSTGVGRISARNPREGFLGDPEAGIFYHPTIVTGLREEDPRSAEKKN